MKKILRVALLLFSVCRAIPNAVTYEPHRGRFGDNLFTFSRVLWVSYKYKLPLVYAPFIYSDLLNLSRLHETITEATLQGRRIVIPEKDINVANLNEKRENILYTLREFSVDIDWNDRSFVELLRKEIALLTPYPRLELPSDRLPVAVHVRTGSGPDKIIQVRTYNPRDTSARSSRFVKFDNEYWPNKFPSIAFYIEQLKRLSQMLADQPLYVHVFTDSPEPEKLVESIQEQVKKPNIEYGFKKKGTQQVEEILGDFFDMTQFEYFIRPDSYFSLMAEKLSNWKITIYPTQSVWKNGRLEVVRFETLTRNT